MITSYATLQTEVLGFLARTSDTELTAALPVLIQLAEGELRDDIRVRTVAVREDFDITDDGIAVPDDYAELEGWYHDGPTYYGPIEPTTLEQLAVLKALYGATGVPRWVALAEDEEGLKAFFAPSPDATYATKVASKKALANLSATVTSNWLLAGHPQVYLYAAARQAAKWLRDPDAATDYGQELDQLLDKMFISNGRIQLSGRLRGRPRRPIGG